jgi:AcrR family transcriptional regulator
MARRPRNIPGMENSPGTGNGENQPGAPNTAGPTGDGDTDRKRIIEAFLALLAVRPIEEIGFGEIAARAGVSLSTLRGEFGSRLAIYAEHFKIIDRQVLEAGDAEMADEPARERLFDVLMRRIEALVPYKDAVRSLLTSAQTDPGLALAVNAIALQSQMWMLTAADINAGGTRGMIRAQGMVYIFARVLQTFVEDDDPGHARTMAALDRQLSRGQQCSNVLDTLCRFVPSSSGRFPFCLPWPFPCPGRPRRRRREDDLDREAIAV